MWDKFNLFTKLYTKGIINKNFLFLCLSRKDAEAIIIGSEMGKRASKITKKITN